MYWFIYLLIYLQYTVYSIHEYLHYIYQQTWRKIHSKSLEITKNIRSGAGFWKRKWSELRIHQDLWLFRTWFLAHPPPLYAGLEMRFTVHSPLYSGLSIMGASHSPSSSSSQSSGFLAFSSTIRFSSTQLSGFLSLQGMPISPTPKSCDFQRNSIRRRIFRL